MVELLLAAPQARDQPHEDTCGGHRCADDEAGSPVDDQVEDQGDRSSKSNGNAYEFRLQNAIRGADDPVLCPPTEELTVHADGAC